MMNVHEIDELRASNEQKKKEAYEKYAKIVSEASEQAARLDKIEVDLVAKLKKSILKHLKGVKPKVIVNEHLIRITLGKEILLLHSYNKTEFHNIDPKVKDSIIADYNEVFVDVEEVGILQWAGEGFKVMLKDIDKEFDNMLQKHPIEFRPPHGFVTDLNCRCTNIKK